MRRVCLTVDVEQDAPPYLSTYRGVEEGLPKLLELFRQEGVPATFFCTGDVARRYPDAVRAIVADGHELGCHADTHVHLDRIDDADARAEIERATDALRAFAPITSFRAPYLRLPPRYLPLLASLSYQVDSSEGAYKRAQVDRGRVDGVTRVPASMTSSVFRLPSMLREAVLARLRDPVVLFVHPWELVDLSRARVRWDCRVGTGPGALLSIGRAVARLRSSDAAFVPMRALA